MCEDIKENILARNKKRNSVERLKQYKRDKWTF